MEDLTGAPDTTARVGELVDLATSRPETAMVNDIRTRFPNVPKTVKPEHCALYDEANEQRRVLKATAERTYSLYEHLVANGAPKEAIANAMLTYRHEEDASMRLGKVLQHLDGGVSVYDKATTVGA